MGHNNHNRIVRTYADIINEGHDEPDTIWSNGKIILEMRAAIGVNDINDSNGEPIRLGQLYEVTMGGRTIPVIDPDDDIDDINDDIIS